MTFVYIVRCNFTAPDKEQAWNAWYSGPKIEQMLAKPHFRTCQRFKRRSGTGRDYLALWTLASPDAFATREYTTDWGFFEWQPHITDWSRDLFDARHAPADAFAVEAGGALHVVGFDGAQAADAKAASESPAPTEHGMIWLPVAGLDRHTPMIGLRPIASGGAYSHPDDPAGGSRQTAIYRPISDLYRARTP